MKYFPPKRLREANIQAELYCRLKEEKIPCYLEYTFKDFEHNRNYRADAIVHKNDKVVCLIEVKSRKKPYYFNQYNTKQLQAYRATGIFTVVCDNFNFEESIKKIKDLYNKFV